MSGKSLLAVLGSLLLSACSGPTAPPASESVSVISSPAAAGSFAPNLTTGHDGSIMMSWLEPTAEDLHALRFSILEEGEWSHPNTVAVGDNWFANWADFPSVNAISSELWAAHWLQRREAGGYAYDIAAVVSSDGGQTWSAPFNPHTDNTDTEHGFVSMFADDGGIGMVWLDGRKFINEVTDDVAASGMTLRSATFDVNGEAHGETLVDNLICDCCQTDVAMTPDGPVAVYRNRTENEIRDIYVARRTAEGWQPGIPVSDDHWEIPGCPVNGPVVQSDGSQVAVAWFSAPSNQGRVQAAWSDDSGATFGNPVMISDNRPTGHVGAVLLDNSDLIVSWQRRIEKGAVELCLQRVSASGDLGDVHVFDEADSMFAISVPQIALHEGDLVLAWTESLDDKYSVRTALMPIDYIQ